MGGKMIDSHSSIEGPGQILHENGNIRYNTNLRFLQNARKPLSLITKIRKAEIRPTLGIIHRLSCNAKSMPEHLLACQHLNFDKLLCAGVCS